MSAEGRIAELEEKVARLEAAFRELVKYTSPHECQTLDEIDSAMSAAADAIE